MRKYIAEFIGTAVLVIFGCGTAVAMNSVFIGIGFPIPIAFTTLIIAFAFGLSVTAMAYAIGDISGCHVNPAVSLGMLICKRIDRKDFVGYVIGQCLGAICGAAFLWACFGGNESLGQNGYGAASVMGIHAGVAFLMEVVMTFVFVLVVLAATGKAEHAATAGLVIGLTLTLVHLFGIPFTGTSVNPARSLGPALLVGGDALKQVWVFLLAPLLGAVIAALVYMLLTEQSFTEPKEADEIEEQTPEEPKVADEIEEQTGDPEPAQEDFVEKAKEADEA